MLTRYCAHTWNISGMFQVSLSNSSQPMSTNMLHTRNISLYVTQISVYQIPLIICKPTYYKYSGQLWRTTLNNHHLTFRTPEWPLSGSQRSWALSCGNPLYHSLYISHYYAKHTSVKFLAWWIYIYGKQFWCRGFSYMTWRFLVITTIRLTEWKKHNDHSMYILLTFINTITMDILVPIGISSSANTLIIQYI